MGKWFTLLMIFLVVVMVIATIESPRKETAWLLATTIVILAVFLGMRTMRVVVTTSELRFGFAYWRKRLPLWDVEIVGVEQIPLLAGIGVHYYPNRWVYNARVGRGVHLVYHEKRHYLIGSDDPDALFNVLKTATASSQRASELISRASQ